LFTVFTPQSSSARTTPLACGTFLSLSSTDPSEPHYEDTQGKYLEIKTLIIDIHISNINRYTKEKNNKK
jgi:hypothetical protein